MCHRKTIRPFHPKPAHVPLVAPVVILFAFGAARAAPTWKHLGDEFKLAEPTPIAELTTHPDRYFNRQVRIEGIVASACTNEGCFIEVVPDGGGYGIVVNFPELIHHFPTDCAGSRAIVEGLFYQKVYPASRVAHWQGHSFRAGKPVPDFALIPRISARAARITVEKGPLPPPSDIPPAQTDRLDLASVEFEADGFGAGRKVLAPGDSTETHSTGKTREIVLCQEGELTVVRPGRPPVSLRAGEMTYIAPATRHAIRNLTDRPAVYVFVFSKAPEPEPRLHEH